VLGIGGLLLSHMLLIIVKFFPNGSRIESFFRFLLRFLFCYIFYPIWSFNRYTDNRIQTWRDNFIRRHSKLNTVGKLQCYSWQQSIQLL